jgi:type II restriction enzyme
MKTEASAGSKPGVITISKFMEVNAISRGQWKSVDDCIDEVVRRFTAHLTHYSRIFMLKGYDAVVGKTEVHSYDLWEIPKSVFLAAGNTGNQERPRDFTKAGGFTININYRNNKAFGLMLDGSDEKLRISSLKTDCCIKHCHWSVKKS